MMSTIAVTCASGKIGRGIVEKLIDKGVNVRAFVRDPSKLSQKGVEVITGDLLKANSLREVYRNADAAFIMLPPLYDREDYRNILRQAAENIIEALIVGNVPRAVMLSSVGADLTIGNGQVGSLTVFEALLRKVPDISVKVLRSAYHMENFLNVMPVIRSYGMIGGIIDPDKRIPMIAVRDVSEAAARYLEDNLRTGFTVQYLLGPKDYTFAEASSIISKQIAIPKLHYSRIPFKDFVAGLVTEGFSNSAAQDLYEGFIALNDGKFTGHIIRDENNTTATGFETFVREVFAPAYMYQLVGQN